MSQPDLPDSAFKRYDKNIEFLTELNPGLIKELEAYDELGSELIFDGETCVNIKIKDAFLYGEGYEKFTSNQIASFKNHSDRIIFSDTSHCNVTNISKGFAEILNDNYFTKQKELDISRVPVTDTGYFFLFGLGSGQIVEEIVQTLEIRNLLIVEPIFEFFIQSMYVVDWEEIYKKADEKGITIHFYKSKDPLYNVEAMEDLVRKLGNTFLDGSYFLGHYASWELKEAYSLLKERIKNYYFTTGFFEDELVMVRNTYLNLINHHFSYMPRQRYLHQDYPVFVVASGPSLEFDLPYLKKIRDQIILVSSGTTLTLLLNNGLRPDYHAEIENVEVVYDFLKRRHDEYGFEGITLLASSTVDVQVASLFDDVFFYARGVVSSSTVFFTQEQAISEVSPMSANAAIAAISTLGFRNIYLSGVDCGRYIGASHHSPGSIYEEIGISEGMETNLNFERKIPGNFGGEVTTTKFLDMSRRSITSLITRLNPTVYNCSHGAKIDLTQPISIGAVKLDSKAGHQEHIKHIVRSQLKQYTPGEYLTEIGFDDTVTLIPAFKEKLSKFLDLQKKECKSLYDFDQEFEIFFNENMKEFGNLLIVIGGSLAAMIRLAAFMGTRIIDVNERHKLIKSFCEAYEEQSFWMVNLLENFYQEMADRKTDIKLPDEFVLKEEDDVKSEA